jgi:cytochrome b6-f complex iron-sulfur subunit
VKRRDAIKIICSTSALVTLLPELASAKKMALSLDKVEKLKEVGGSAILKIKGKEILFIRESEEVIRALDPTCTHKKCTVEYNSDQELIVCPCHGSTYSSEGKVITGPAKESLTAFEATLSENRIIFDLD